MADKKTLSMDEIVTEQKVSRRGAMGAIGAGAAFGAAVIAMGASNAQAQQAEELCSDRDPSDGVNHARCRGISDSDPSDARGCGRRSCSDSDPNDAAGWGCRC